MKSAFFALLAGCLISLAGHTQCTLSAAPSVVHPTNCGAINGSIFLPGLNGLQSLYAVTYKKNNVLTTAELSSSGSGLSIIHLGKGNYTDITIVYDNGTCSGNVPGPFILFDGSPVITGTPEADTICPGQSVILNAAGGNIYNWYPSAGLNTNSGNMVVATPTQSTTYLVIGATGPCSSMDSITIIVTASLEVNQAADQVTCHGNSFPGLSFSGSAGTSFRWTNSQPAIGLPAEGKGNLPAFIASNPGSAPVTSLVTVIPENTWNGFAYLLRTQLNDVIVYNTNTETIATSLAVGSAPSAIAIAPSGNRIYIANRNSNSVSVITSSSHTVTATIPVGLAPSGLAVSPDGNWLYVSNQNANTISIVNTSNNSVQKTLAIGGAPAGLAFSTNGSKAYVANSGSNTVSVIDVAAQALLTTINVGTAPLTLAMTPDGSKLYVVNSGSNSVSVINTTTDVVINTINVGSQPNGIAMAPNGSKAYVTNKLSGNISVIETSSGAVGTPLPAGAAPQGISIRQDGEKLWVTNSTGVQIVNTLTGSATTITLAGGLNALGDFISGASCQGLSKNFYITVNPLPHAVIAYPSASYCNVAGTAQAQLTGTTGGSFSSSTGLQINQATGLIDLGASLPGIYQVQYLIPASGGCQSFSTQTSLTIHPLPAQAVISQSGLTLQSSAPQGNQWYLNGQPVAGATGQVYTPVQSGNYTVVVTLNGCQGPSSAAYTYIMTSLTEVKLESILRISPNPVHDLLHLKLEGLSRPLSYTLLDAKGRVVIRMFRAAGNRVINMSGLANGIYILEVVDQKTGERCMWKLIKN